MKVFLSGVVVGGIICLQMLSPTVVSAQTLPTSEEGKLQQLQALLQQLIELRDQLLALDSQQTSNTGAVPKLSEDTEEFIAQFYDGEYEAKYVVKNGLLAREGGAPPTAAHQELFSILVTVMGEVKIDTYIREFRLYEDDGVAFDAFTVLTPTPNYWIVAVNTATTPLENDLDIEATVDLFVHEYAHILLQQYPDFVDDFTDTYWGDADYDHSKSLTKAKDSKVDRLRREYYDNNKSRFVSVYATTNPDEDMAETFLEFVRNPKPGGRNTVEKKVRFFYDNTFTTIRSDIRARLLAAGRL